jgi:hypothetical protein
VAWHARSGRYALSVASQNPKRRRLTSGPPEAGWTFGASGFPSVAWAVLALCLAGLAVFLFVVGYLGYGVVIAILAAAAAVNLLP